MASPRHQGTGVERPSMGDVPGLIRSRAAALGSGMVALVGWEAMVALLSVPTVLLPAPSEIVVALLANAGAMAPHVARTVVEVVVGWTLGVTVGATFAAAMALSPRLRRVLYPYLVAMRIVPLVVVAPLLVVFFGPTTTTAVLLAALLTFFPVTIAALDGLLAVPAGQLAVVRSVGAPAWKAFLFVRVPNALPGIFTGIKLAAPLAVQAVVIAEFLASTRGIGAKLLETARELETPLLFAYLAVLVAVGVVAFGLASLLERAARWDTEGGAVTERLRTAGASSFDVRPADAALAALVGAAALASWYGVATIHPHADVFVPTPDAALASGVASTGLLLAATVETVRTLLVGWAVGAAVGFALGALAGTVPAARPVVYPYVVGVRITPQIALAPLLLLWFGISFTSAVVIVALTTFFPVAIATATGLSSVPDQYLTLLRSVDAPAWHVLAVRFRYAVPTVFAGLKLSAVAAVSGTIIAEWFVAETGLGVLVLYGVTELLPELTFAAIWWLFALGGGLFLLVAAVQRRLSW